MRVLLFVFAVTEGISIAKEETLLQPAVDCDLFSSCLFLLFLIWCIELQLLL